MDLAAAAKFHDPYDTNALFKESDVHLFANETVELILFICFGNTCAAVFTFPPTQCFIHSLALNECKSNTIWFGG